MKSLHCSWIGTRFGLKSFFACFVLATGAMWYYLINQATCEHIEIKLPKQDSTAIIAIVTNNTVCKLNTVPATAKCDSGQGAADKLRLDRDIFGQLFASPPYVLSQLYGQSVPRFSVNPGDIPNTAHYVWCGQKLFRFEHYLAVLSIVKVLKPMKVVFHYNELPTVEKLYHTWFQEMRQSLPNLVLRKTTSSLKCDTSEGLNFGLEQLASSVGGGFYFGERSVLSYIPSYWTHEKYLTYLAPGANSNEELIVFTKHGLFEPNVTLEQFKSKLLNKSYECLTLDKFNQVMTSQELINSKAPDDILSPCLVAPKQLYPENIINNTTPFGGLARSLYYGKTEILVAKPSGDPKDLIPAISHMISLNPKPGQPVEFSFGHYLSTLSALYLGGFERVYIHGDTEPSGEWWSRLHGENVTFVFVENIETVFQQGVKVLAHQSDILRTMVLLKYGGAYQDKDALWVNQVPEDVRRYSTVACLDWPTYEEWPRTFNLGIFMSKPGAPFLKHFLDSFWYQWDSSWIFNGIQMPYKIYERHPETLHIYSRLQIICYVGVCHPTWHEDYLRNMGDAHKPTGKFELEDAHALHFTYPKPDPSLTSFDAIKKGTNLPAELGKKLVGAIQRSGRVHLLA